MTRRSLRQLCWLLVGALLYAQMAIAAYACPRLAEGGNMGLPMVSAVATDDEARTASADQADASGADCNGMVGAMDPASPNLCAEHCRYGQQSDLASTIAVPVVLLTTLYIAPPLPELLVSPHSAADSTSALAVASPPHAILHCCFRI